MFVMEEGNSILVYNNLGKLVYKSAKILQYKKFDSESLVIITESSVDFVNQTSTKDRQDITVVNDTRFVSAYIQDNLIFIQRKIGIPMIDIYDNQFINIMRLYQNINGKWVHFLLKMGIPYKVIIPTYLEGEILYGVRKGKVVSFNLQTKELKICKVKPSGVPLAIILNKFKTGVNQ